MSPRLALGTKPNGLEIKTFGLMGDNTVYLGDYEISLVDFLCAAEYVLTNSDLQQNDPRRQFVRCIQSMREIEGFNMNGRRLSSSIPPALC